MEVFSCPVLSYFLEGFAFWKFWDLFQLSFWQEKHLVEDEYGVMVERRWYERPSYLERNVPQYHFVHKKSHVDWPGIETSPSAMKGKRVTARVNGTTN